MIHPLRHSYNLLLGGALALLALVPVTLGYLTASLPSVASLKDMRLEVPLRVYSRDGNLLAEFGNERRDPVTLDAVPPTLVQAVVAAEDAHFFEHPGIDWEGLARAVRHLVKTGEKGPGGSTITMQVAREFFLGREKTFDRKLNELLLALRIERELSKQAILELYLNKTFFGQRAYGVAAAAQVYYGKDLGSLTLPEVAMIAGLPQAPSRLNPVADRPHAVQRRNYVLRRMHELGHIDAETYRAAAAAPDTARLRRVFAETEAPHLAEMVRVTLESRLGEEAYAGGLRVYTTLDSALQATAVRAVREGLMAYDRRHGYRGPEGRVDPAAAPAELDRALARHPPIANLIPAAVLRVGERGAAVYTSDTGELPLGWEAIAWARPHLDTDRTGPAPRRAKDILRPGDIVRIRAEGDGWRLAALPQAEGALVALDPRDGAVRALVGGLDFEQSQFNRVTQAQRQPGSSFKPFIYSAALERGYTPASVIDDSPVAYYDPGTRSTWRPENYDGEFHGPTRLREALAQSRNVVAIKLLEAVGVDLAVDHSARFGLDRQRLPRNLSLALGTGGVTPLELATAYAVFANGGFLVDPYFIERVEDARGQVILQARPRQACPTCEQARAANARAEAAEGDAETAPRVLDPRNAFLLSSMLGDVVARGTARAARSLGRKDLAGKTGTTNDFQDAWFAGYNPSLVAVAWVGFDQVQPLGKGETGSRAALPIWMDFMRTALAGTPEAVPAPPPDLVTVRIDPLTGEAAYPDQEDAVTETFPVEFAPFGAEGAEEAGGRVGRGRGRRLDPAGVTEALF